MKRSKMVVSSVTYGHEDVHDIAEKCLQLLSRSQIRSNGFEDLLKVKSDHKGKDGNSNGRPQRSGGTAR